MIEEESDRKTDVERKNNGGRSWWWSKMAVEITIEDVRGKKKEKNAP